MAGCAIRSELSAVRILGGMTGITICRCALIAIRVAGLAGDMRVLARQRKACSSVIEIHISPAACVMTLSTTRAKLPVVLVILLMA